jgi:hypothetical protein
VKYSFARKTFAWKSVIKTIRNRGAFILRGFVPNLFCSFVPNFAGSAKFILRGVQNLFCQGVPMMRFVLFKG